MVPHELTEKIPEYLLPYVVKQDPLLYTAMDHASWRFILKLSQAYFADNAHSMYLDGLRETGISTERIPLISEMDARLRKFNWRAVAVSGFIPPAVFMEFLSLGVLPIACDMRSLEHLSYTPAPDIVHEAAGHAPIIADPSYARYLRSYGEISRKAIFSHQDMEVYLAIRDLSETKENPASEEEDIFRAQARLDQAVSQVDYVSEATELARMSWWTIEYGLIGDFKKPKIYGAGLLSSLGESFHCFDPNVKLVPFDLDCIRVTYDITRPQPQLFVAPNFDYLVTVLDRLSETMAFRVGGKSALDKALRAKTVTCAEFETGIQISGVLTQILEDSTGQPCYLKFEGPTQLACDERQLTGQGPDYHKEGFGTPIGLLKDGRCPGELTDQEVADGGLEFGSGVVVTGRFTGAIREQGKALVLSFADCTVKKGDELLFRPEWGTFDMACGARVVSVRGTPADRRSYLAATTGFGESSGRQKSNLTAKNRGLNELYAQVREIRESGNGSENLGRIHDQLVRDYPTDWLLRFELLELNASRRLNASWAPVVLAELKRIGSQNEPIAEMTARGLETLV